MGVCKRERSLEVVDENESEYKSTTGTTTRVTYLSSLVFPKDESLKHGGKGCYLKEF